MVTLITEQLRKQSLEEAPYRRAFSLNVALAETEGSPAVCWGGCGLTESGWPVFPPAEAQDARDSSPLPGSPPPPPPPPKRHCRSLSVPEDLSRCLPWRPGASKIWTPVKRRCHSGGGAGLGYGGQLPSSSSIPSSSSSSPTFFSLALSPDSLLPWSFPWETCERLLLPSSCCSSPALPGPSPPLLQRRFSLSPVHVQKVSSSSSVFLLPPQPSPPPPALPPPSPSPSSACSTPSSLRRVPRPPLPRCHSQPCDLRKPGLKRRHDADPLPCPRPGLDFSKMTQIVSREPLACGAGSLGPGLWDVRGALSPTELLGRTSIGPLSESEEEEEEDERMGCVGEAALQSVFERDCIELDLNLIEEN